MKTTVKKAKGGTRQKTLKEEKRDIGRSLKSFGKKVASKLKGKCAKSATIRNRCRLIPLLRALSWRWAIASPNTSDRAPWRSVVIRPVGAGDAVRLMNAAWRKLPLVACVIAMAWDTQ